MKVALVLGSGGARGYAHIGVIEELEARGHEIVSISGTSMGALIGGVYCAGALEAVKEFAVTLGRAEVLRMTDFTLRAPGLIKLQRAMLQLREFIGDVRIEDLPIPYTAVATDIRNMNEVWFRKGSLLTAIRASISIPAVFTPVWLGERLLVDGGLLNPLPVDPAMDTPCDGIIGVSLFGHHRRGPTSESADEATVEEDGDASWLSKVGESFADSSIGQRLQNMFGGSASNRLEVERITADLPGDVSFTDMAITALDMMQGRIEVARSAMNAPDVLISVPMDLCSALDFHLARQVIDKGRELARVEFDRVGI